MTLQPVGQDVFLVLSHLPLLASLVTLLVNVYLLVCVSAVMFRCPLRVLLQMATNLVVDAMVWLLAMIGGWLGGSGRESWTGAASGVGDGLKGAGFRNLGLLEVSLSFLTRSVELSELTNACSSPNPRRRTCSRCLLLPRPPSSTAHSTRPSSSCLPLRSSSGRLLHRKPTTGSSMPSSFACATMTPSVVCRPRTRLLRQAHPSPSP